MSHAARGGQTLLFKSPNAGVFTVKFVFRDFWGFTRSVLFKNMTIILLITSFKCKNRPPHMVRHIPAGCELAFFSLLLHINSSALKIRLFLFHILSADEIFIQILCMRSQCQQRGKKIWMKSNSQTAWIYLPQNPRRKILNWKKFCILRWLTF